MEEQRFDRIRSDKQAERSGRQIVRRATERQLRLMCVAVLRSAPINPRGESVWDLLSSWKWGTLLSEIEGQVIGWPGRRTIEAIEQEAEASCPHSELSNARRAARWAARWTEGRTYENSESDRDGIRRENEAAHCILQAASEDIVELRRLLLGWLNPGYPMGRRFTPKYHRPAVQQIVLDIGESVILPIPRDPSPQHPELVRMATVIYRDRLFSDLPILADLLEESGNEDARMLEHLRKPGRHHRGCWVLDWILGK